MKAKFAVHFLFVCIFTTSSFSQSQPGSGVTPEMRTAANGLYQASDWANAAAVYGKIVALEPANPNANYRLGLSLLNLNRNVEAQKHLDKAFTTSPNPIFALALARSYARAGDKAKALETIDKTTAIGGIAPETLTAEKDFAAWKDDAGFKEIVRKNDLAVNPCKASPEFRQFDFWIGDWDVKNLQGVPSGSSSVQLILGQCTIFENWTSGSGSSGKSFNIYDTKDKKWHQTWVDDKGTFAHYVGGFQDGKMVIVADTVSGGKKALAKMTFSRLPNGDVRQFGENSADDGKTWTTSFDLTYSRRK
ncbi:MAG: tetratricopeptide repeat protein [Pyrinomonadaceae bacterium]